MRKKKLFFKLTLILLLQIVIVIKSYAQLSMEKQSQEIVLPNTQTYDFIRYGTVGASLYTGTVNYSIPIYTYKDNDFELPISLDYASNGYKPNSRGGDVGVGWTLNAGGCITREVRGIPDEKTKLIDPKTPNILSPSFRTINLKGFTYSHKENINSDDELTYSYNDDYNLYFYKSPTIGAGYEITPDIFHFNFMGYTGYFYFWYNNEIKVYTNNPDHIINVEYSNSISQTDEFILTTNDGYKYYFGKYESKESVQSEIFRDITYTWKLTNIISPNNRSITFTYSDPTNRLYVEQFNPSSIFSTGVLLYTEDNEPINEKFINSTKVYYSPLSRITISDGIQVDFKYIDSNGEKNLFGEGGFVQNTRNSPKLKEITIFNSSNNDILQKCNLNYKVSKTNNTSPLQIRDNSVYHLGEVFISGLGKFIMDYNNIDSDGFPALGTYAIDYWGYYNGKNENGAINYINHLSYSSQFDEISSSNIREFDVNYAKYGMLNQIKYPTGGKSIIYYEAHDYSQSLINNSSTTYAPTLINQNANIFTGGLRIKSVETYDANEVLINTKNYTYKLDNNMSSGILLNIPRYGLNYIAMSNNSGSYIKHVKHYNLNNICKLNNTHIEYSRVIEQEDDTSKRIFSFTNYNDYPDEDAIVNSFDIPSIVFDYFPGHGYSMSAIYFNINSPYAYYITKLLTPQSSNQFKRGKLKSLELYSGNELKFSKQLEYNEFNDNNVDYPIITGETATIISERSYSFWKTDDNIFTNYSQGNIEQKVSYTFNYKGQISVLTRLTSSGESEIIRYKYPIDLQSSGGIYTTMISRNLLNYPISEETFIRKDNNSEVQTAGKRYTYNLFNNIVKPSKLEIYNPTTQSWETQTTFMSYDVKGNLTESKDANGVSTSYIWGYNGLYLVAKGENITYSILSTLTGASSNLVAGITANYKTIREAHPDAAFNFYEYKPFIGISKHEDESGNVLSYEYNTSGKLKSITNHDGKLVNQYLYSPDNKQ